MSMSVVPLPNSFGSRWAFDRVPKTIKWAWFTSVRRVWLALGQNGQADAAAGTSRRRARPRATDTRSRGRNMVGRLEAGWPARRVGPVAVRVLSRTGPAPGKQAAPKLGKRSGG